MEALHSSEASFNIHHSQWCSIPEDIRCHQHCCENLKYHNSYFTCFDFAAVSAIYPSIITSTQKKVKGHEVLHKI